MGGLVLAPFAFYQLKKRKITILSSDWKRFALLGFLCVVLSMVFYQMAVVSTKASAVAVVFSSNPVFVLIFAYFILQEPIQKNNIFSLILDILGIIVIINPLHTELNLIGIFLSILAALFFALYGVMGKKSCQKYGGLPVTCFSFLFGSVQMAVLSLGTHIPAVSSFLLENGLQNFSSIPFFTGYSLENLPIILFIFVGVTGIGYVAYFRAMEETSANTASLTFFFKPILAPILAALFLREEITLSMIIGIAFILSGSLVSLLPSFFRTKKA